MPHRAFHTRDRVYSANACRVSMPDNESLCKTVFGIRFSELETVVALLAAQACGLPGATQAQIVEITGREAPRGMIYLERNLWVVRVGRVEKSTAWVWAASPHAAKRLELVGWQVELQPAEEERAAS